MVSTLSTAAAGVLSFVGWWLRSAPPAGVATTNRWELLATLMLFVAVITGFVTLSITPLVFRFRRVRPPLVVTVVAVAVAAAPFAVLVWIASR